VTIDLPNGPHGAVPLYRDEFGAVAAYTRIGRGGIVWCTSPWSFSNQAIAQEQNLEFVLALARLDPQAPILFDEYHHGFGAGMSVWTVAPPLTKLGIAQLALALLLLLITLAWRFGPQHLPVEERFTRSRAEYLTSMAGLLERTQATHVVLQRLRLRVARAVSRRLGRAADTAFYQLRQANAQIHAFDPALLDLVTRRLEQLEGTRPDVAVVYQLAVQVERLLARRKG